MTNREVYIIVITIIKMNGMSDTEQSTCYEVYYSYVSMWVCVYIYIYTHTCI